MGRLLDSPLHLLIIVLVLVVVFGAKKLPDVSRSVARSMRVFKSEVREMKEEDRRESATTTTSTGATAASSTTSTPGTPAHPLEGRVVTETHSVPTEAQRLADEQRRSA